MLRTHAPFPQVGSFALFEHEGKSQLARIVGRHPADATAVISLPERPDAGGNLTVPVAGLIDGTPLTDAEAAELRQLESACLPYVSKRKRVRTARQKEIMRRFGELSARRIHARVLGDKIEWYESLPRRVA